MGQVEEAPSPNPAEIYEQTIVRVVFQPLARRVIELAPPRIGDRVLDVASGTGIVLRELARFVGDTGHLVALDLTPEMIAVGRSITEAQGLCVEWHQGSADALPFPDESFDWVYCQQALPFFPDKPAALREMRRVLRNGGQAVISVWQSLDRHPYYRVIDEAAFAYAGIHILQGPFSLGDSGELADLARQAGFDDVRVIPVQLVTRWDDPVSAVRAQVTSATAAIPSLQHLKETERADLINGIISHVEPELEQYIEDGVLVNSWLGNVAIATK